MKLGVVHTVFYRNTLEEALGECRRLGLEYMEIGGGGYLPKNHIDVRELSRDVDALNQFRESLAEHDVSLSALAIHGQPLHPDATVSNAYGQEFRATCKIADGLGVDRLTLLAGLPGAGPEDLHPNWITYPFPPENIERLAWQWSERLIPYWREHAKIAEDHGVKLCFELHPADLVFQPSGLLRLRREIGPVVGANLDPSHLTWQGMDIRTVILALGDAIYHVHAKDSWLNPAVIREDGVLDAKHHKYENERAWIFRTIGYGNSEQWWRDFVSTLRMVGYDYVLSIEHEDSLMDPIEGLERAVEFLRRIVPDRPGAELWYE